MATEVRYVGELLPKNIANDSRLYNLVLDGDYINQTGSYKLTLDLNAAQATQSTINMLPNKAYVIGVKLNIDIFDRGTTDAVILNDQEVKTHIATMNTSTVRDSGFDGTSIFVELSVAPFGLLQIPANDIYDYVITSAEIIVDDATDDSVRSKAKHLSFCPRPEEIAQQYPRVPSELTVSFVENKLYITKSDGSVTPLTAEISQAVLDAIYANAKGLYTPIGITVPVNGGTLLGSDNLIADTVYVASDSKFYINIGGDRPWDRTVSLPDGELFEVSWHALLKYTMDKIKSMEDDNKALLEGTLIRLPMNKNFLSMDYNRALTSMEGIEPLGLHGVLHDSVNFRSGLAVTDTNGEDYYVLQGAINDDGLIKDTNDKVRVDYNIPTDNIIGTNIKSLVFKFGEVDIPTGKANITFLSGGDNHSVHIIGASDLALFKTHCNKEVNTLVVNKIIPTGSDLVLTDVYINGVQVNNLVRVNTSATNTLNSIRVSGSSDPFTEGSLTATIYQIALFKEDLTDDEIVNLNRSSLLSIYSGDRLPTPKGVMKGNHNGNISDYVTIEDHSIHVAKASSNNIYQIISRDAKMYTGRSLNGSVEGFGVSELGGNVMIDSSIQLPCLLKIITLEV